MTSEPLNQYTEICRDAIKSSSAKVSKTFENLLLEILLLYMTIQRKINFTQMERYGTHCEQTYRTNFNRGRAKCIDWVKFNLALCRRYLNMDGLLAIAIDPSYISKSDGRAASCNCWHRHRQEPVPWFQVHASWNLHNRTRKYRYAESSIKELFGWQRKTA